MRELELRYNLMLLEAKMVDSFQVRRPKTHKLAQNENPNCAFKGCNRAGQVMLYYTMPGESSQQRDRICFDHALQLANEIILELRS